MPVADESQIHFRPLELADLELMHRWLNGDFVARWWPGWPTLEQVRAKYTPRITGEDPTRGFIIERDGNSIGFIQCYRDVADAPHFSSLLAEPERAAGIDLFIGERANAYRGLGPHIIYRFLREVVFAPPETSVCIIDPAQNNFAAIRAYEKTGFRRVGTVHAPGELEPSCVMIIRREDLARDE
jgi:RimJ/RimL family protein N-acetyltransferase